VLVERAGRTWVAADEWLGGGETFQRWVALRPGEQLRLRINGEEVEGNR
jgi:hypothetical protein